MSNEHAVASAIIRLMQGVVYRESDQDTWLTLERLGAGVRDHFATIGVDVVVDDAEGFAYLRSRPDEEGDDALPRLVRRTSARIYAIYARGCVLPGRRSSTNSPSTQPHCVACSESDRSKRLSCSTRPSR